MEKLYNPQFYTNNELKNKSGIYQIRNLVNGKLYIGSAVNLYDRKSQHFSDLKYGKHNDRFQNSYNFHGKDNFIFEVIEFVEDENKLIECEQYWMDRFEVYKRDKGYNINPIAGRPPNTEETRKKMSKNHADVSGSKNPSAKSVVRLEDGKVFLTMKEAVENSELKYISQICIACSSRNHIAGKYHWLYKEDFDNKTYEEIKYILNTNKGRGILVRCIETDIIYSSIREANIKTGIGVNIIAQYCYGIRPNHLKDKFTWEIA